MMPHLFCIAPMLDWTDRHCRFFLRLLSRHVRLYTEMVTTGAVLRGDRDRLLAYDPAEHPLALQLGGSDPADLARCAHIAAEWGYDEVNLNVGCPSDRVQSGRFGACLMAEPELVAECVAAGTCQGGVVFCADPGLVCCVANKFAGLRAVPVLSVAQAARATLSLAANLLAVEMPGRTFFEVRQILRLLCAGPGACCPPDVLATLTELEHAHR